MIERINLNTRAKTELINLTEAIQEKVNKLEVRDGLLFLFNPHTTAALIINEDEKGLEEDFIKLLEDLVPNGNFKHDLVDNNTRSHLLSNIFSNQKTFIIENGNLLLGTWQNIFFLELDGPRKRELILRISR